MVKVRGRNSNRKTVKQTVKNGRKVSGDDAARPAWVMVPGVSSSRLRLINPEFDAVLDRDSCVTHWMSSPAPGSALWYTDIWQSFFFSCRFVSVVFDKTVTEYRVWRNLCIHGTAEEVRCYPQIPVATSVTSRGRPWRFCKSMYAAVWGAMAHASACNSEGSEGKTVALASWWSLQCARARTRVGALASPVAIRQGELTLQIERSFGSHFSSWRKASAPITRRYLESTTLN